MNVLSTTEAVVEEGEQVTANDRLAVDLASADDRGLDPRVKPVNKRT
jgi:hypothetical protein